MEPELGPRRLVCWAAGIARMLVQIGSATFFFATIQNLSRSQDFVSYLLLITSPCVLAPNTCFNARKSAHPPPSSCPSPFPLPTFPSSKRTSICTMDSEHNTPAPPRLLPSRFKRNSQPLSVSSLNLAFSSSSPAPKASIGSTSSNLNSNSGSAQYSN
ncbi:hypothetical protein B0H14DRAFT_1340601 [Mycena olivaceomarginata]|nr:hypothetical protein B0H14DRAFT_1340601 [Mycena olivaceomarginata]